MTGTMDRRRYLGGHDVAAILLGEQYQYDTPYGVWLKKTSPEPEPPQGEGEWWEGWPSEAAYWGSDAEEGMAKAYTLRTGRKVTRNDDTFEHLLSPHLAGTPDGYVDDDGIVEFKTASEWVMRNAGDELPAHYTIQGLYYLGLTGLAWCDFVVKVGGNQLEIRRVRREERRADIEAIIEFADAWWKVHVEGNVAPPISGSSATRDALLTRFGIPTQIERVDVDDEWRDVLEERHRTHALIKDLEQQLAELDCRLAAALNGGTDAYLPGDDKPSWTWRATTTTRDQPKALREAREAALPTPDGVTETDLATAVRVLDAYRTTTEGRRLDCKQPRKKKDA